MELAANYAIRGGCVMKEEEVDEPESTSHEPRIGCGSDRAYERQPSVRRMKMREDAQK